MKLDKAVFRLMIGIIIMCCLASLFAFPSQAWASKELNVPYIRQVGDTADEFEGDWACGATSAVMIVAYYGRLQPDQNFWVHKCDGGHKSEYGKYVSMQYEVYGYTFNEFKEPDPGNDQVYGAYGYIHDYCYDSTPGCAHAEFAKGYFRRHGLFSKVVYHPTEAEVKDEIDKGHPVWASTSLWEEYGHVVVIKGYTDDGYYIVNDPGIHGDFDCGMGNDKYYTWSQMGTESRRIVITDPIRPGDKVKALYDDIHVREEPSLSAVDKGYVGDTGTIVYDSTYGSCFYNSDGYTWWKIQWDNGKEGWSACGAKTNRNGGENWIEKVTTAETLSVSLTTDPSSGNAPLDVTLTADVSGTATGTINYTFWWNCNDPGTSVGDVMNVCGYIPTPSPGSCASNENGIKCDGVTDDPKIVSHTYSSPGRYTAKVIAERGSADPAEDRVTITVNQQNHSPNTPSTPSGPSSGYTGTSYSFSTSATDPDGDPLTYRFDWGDGNISSWGASSQSHGWDSTGNFCIKVQAKDSHGATSSWSDCHYITITFPYHDPELNSGDVSPDSGDTSTTFTYTVKYYDQDGDSPSAKYVYIDGSPHTMSLYTGSASNGTYRYRTTLSAGSHNYYFYFTDGNGGSDRLPSSGTYSGPDVSPPPDTPPDTTITSGPSGTIDYNDVGFSWTGSDDVTPTSDLLYSYKLEGYDSDWSGYSPSTTKSYNDLPNGSYTFYVKAKDKAGNVDPSPDSQSFTVNVCTYSISPPSKHFGPTGGTGTINVTTQAGCSWTAVSHADWITITGGSSGTDSGIVYYSVSENSSTSSRTGTITIADQTFIVTQSGTSAHKSMPWLHLLLGE